jgi:hypothetical protein
MSTAEAAISNPNAYRAKSDTIPVKAYSESIKW